MADLPRERTKTPDPIVRMNAGRTALTEKISRANEPGRIVARPTSRPSQGRWNPPGKATRGARPRHPRRSIMLDLFKSLRRGALVLAAGAVLALSATAVAHAGGHHHHKGHHHHGHHHHGHHPPLLALPPSLCRRLWALLVLAQRVRLALGLRHVRVRPLPVAEWLLTPAIGSSALLPSADGRAGRSLPLLGSQRLDASPAAVAQSGERLIVGQEVRGQGTQGPRGGTKWAARPSGAGAGGGPRIRPSLPGDIHRL